MSKKNQLLHVAFIMDGNGRWAKKRGLPRHLGHKEGCERIIDIYEECRVMGIKVMSLYAFSTENWNRPKDEIRHLFNYLEIFFKRELKRMKREGCKIITSGDISKLPKKTVKVVENAIDETKDNTDFTFNICLNYGGKAEIVRAAKNFAIDCMNGKKNPEDLDETLFEDYLYTRGLPPVDLLIRTSGEMRTSNYMPWQLAYAEMVFPSTPWPDFTKAKFREVIELYYQRDRRFGEIKDEEK
ncbi:MAG: di-trans,poly-cis-decaprenylcistransferase [Bacilli bacterium]|nr:di-trans,poly-cis-decaprenylcistransferase [Bacilli bacterium]